MIDNHSHIDFECFEHRMNDILENAKTNGIEKILIPGVTDKDFQRIINLIELHDNLYGAIGIHPSETKDFNENKLNSVIKYAKHPRVVAIGEIGLDYYWDKSFMEDQKKALIAQIEIAKEIKKPIIIHDRDAHEDTFNILKDTNANEAGVVMHCFSGSYEFAQRCVKEGFYIALGGVVTFKNAKKTKEIAEKIPLEFLLLETDAPFLTPVPHKGEENEPAYTRYVAEEIAKIKNMSIDEVDKQTTANACNLFKFCENTDV